MSGWFAYRDEAINFVAMCIQLGCIIYLAHLAVRAFRWAAGDGWRRKR